MNHPVHRQRLQKCGWLKKQGGVVRSWHKRWFALNGDCLFYFAKEDDLASLGSIFLPGNRVMEHPQSGDEPDKYLFEILPGKTQNKMAPNHESYLLWAASEEERKVWIKTIRKVMYSSVGGAIFGQSIEETMEYEHKRGNKIPFIIKQCVDFIRTYGIDTEGIFRLAGRTALMRTFREKFDCGEKVILDSAEVDVHSVASILKQYLRELPESIIPCNLYQKFMNKAMSFQSAKDKEQKLEYVESLKNLMTDLPVDNYNILEYLCTFLEDVASREEYNKMSCSNLSVVFGPNIIRHMDDNPELFMATADITQQLTFMMISYREKVFTLSYDTPSSVVAVDDLLRLDDEMVASDNILKPNVTLESEALKDIAFIDSPFEHSTLIRSYSDQSDQSVTSPVSLSSNIDFSSRKSSSSETLSINSSDFKRSTMNGRPIPPKRLSKQNRNSKSDDSPSPSLSPSPSPRQENPPLLVSVTNHEESDLHEVEQTPEQRVLELESLLAHVKTEMSKLKTKYDSKIKALLSEQKKMRGGYENSIEVQKKITISREKDLLQKLESEKNARAEAVEKVISLQAQLHQYQLHYGELN